MNWPVGTKLYVVYAEDGRWSSGPTVLADDGQHEEGWLEGVLAQAREKGCTIVSATVTSDERIGLHT